MAEKVGMSEALRRVGDENITFQRLDTDAMRIDVGKREAKVTFVTDPDNANRLASGELQGLVVWVGAQALRTAVFGESAR